MLGVAPKARPRPTCWTGAWVSPARLRQGRAATAFAAELGGFAGMPAPGLLDCGRGAAGAPGPGRGGRGLRGGAGGVRGQARAAEGGRGAVGGVAEGMGGGSMG